jgi:hypothetical protein
MSEHPDAPLSVSLSLLVRLRLTVPAVRLANIEAFLGDLDRLGIPWEARMDSHPSLAEIQTLPPQLRKALGHE